MALAVIFGALLVFINIFVHYEVLRLVLGLLPRLAMPPRARMLIVVFAAFGAHTVEVWLYGVAYYFMDQYHGLGRFVGEFKGEFFDYVYFSAVTYTSLGFGDVYPTGPLRLITGIEGLNGLLLITWSASFTYLAMQKFWDLHRESNAPGEGRSEEERSVREPGLP